MVRLLVANVTSTIMRETQDAHCGQAAFGLDPASAKAVGKPR
jgi:hypothetical protein